MRYIAAFCKNKTPNSFENVVFFRFPKQPEVRQKWVLFCRRQNEDITENSRICSLHFNYNDLYVVRQGGKLMINSGAFPVFEKVINISDDDQGFPITNNDGCSSVSSKGMFHREKEIENSASYSSLGSTVTACSDGFGETALEYEKLSKQPKCRLIQTIQKLKRRDCSKNRILKLLRKRITRLEKKYHVSKEAASILFNPEQVTLIKNSLKRVRKWSDKTMTESFGVRFACGTKGYKYLRNEKKYPYPSVRTQQKHLENFHFDSGILDETFTLLSSKVESMTEAERDCGLVLDEMSIDQSLSFCSNNKKFFGGVTIPTQSGKATHGLVIMLVGIASRWKQIAAYHFTANAIPDGFLMNMVLDIIRMSEKIGLKVHFVTSDCGPNNIRMWNNFGLKHAKSNVLAVPLSTIQYGLMTHLRLSLMLPMFLNVWFKAG
ncbi:uncharacterized protein LOC129724340 isoform X2 [Wyeomyia smithii]|uniref:uncharacterized protein LOC129724340 isoform X2 n=1 Tax=Wyeomyia smithii TaxID=174621 RepID=UPI002467DF0C|nr:uncharacterized protein LOC129724340 isoform X2 [Wyeomyia smithii]